MSPIHSLIARAAGAVVIGLLALVLLPAHPAAAKGQPPAGLTIATVSKSHTSTVTASRTNTSPYGQCTYYAKMRRPDIGNHWGDAKYWAGRARAAGYSVGKTPRVGDVVV